MALNPLLFLITVICSNFTKLFMFPCRNLLKLVYLLNVLVTFLQRYHNFHLLLTSHELTLENLYLKHLSNINLTTSDIFVLLSAAAENWSKALPLIQFPIEFGYLYFWKFSVNIVVVLGLEETVSKSPALEFDELVVDGKRRQVSILSILSCIFYHQIKKCCSFHYQVLHLELIQESHYLIALSVHFVQLHYFYMILVSIYEANFLVQIHLKTL